MKMNTLSYNQERNQDFANGGAWKWKTFVTTFIFSDVIFTTS